ncbi:MAG TPA: hypothetical protein VF026_02795 [Ktedonobacteraceae bacterium]
MNNRPNHHSHTESVALSPGIPWCFPTSFDEGRRQTTSGQAVAKRRPEPAKRPGAMSGENTAPGLVLTASLACSFAPICFQVGDAER